MRSALFFFLVAIYSAPTLAERLEIPSLDPKNRAYLEAFCAYHPSSGLCFFTPNPSAKPTPPGDGGPGADDDGGGPGDDDDDDEPVDCESGEPVEMTCTSPRDDLFLNPFNKDSAHHRPIGCGAVYADANHPATRTWNTRSGIGINVGMPFGMYAAKGDPSDPLQTIKGTGYGLPTELRLPVGFDPGAVPGRDSVVSLLTLDNREVHDLWRFEVRADGFHAGINRTYAGDELGHPSRLGERLGVSASGVGLLFGALRGAEINTPGRNIQHALQMVIPGTGSNSMLSKEIRLPAGSMDNFCRDNPTVNCLGNIPYGGLLALPPESKGGPDLNALGLSEPGLRLAEAIRDYGVYAVDTGGAVAIRADQHVSPEVRRQLVSSDLPKIYRHMRLVLNSAWTPGQQAVGGGGQLAPNCAFDAR